MPDAWAICRGLFRLARSPAALPRAAGLARAPCRPAHRYLVEPIFLIRLTRTCLEYLSQTGQGFRKSRPLQAQLATTRILETTPLPEPLAKRVENASLATFSGHLKGGVHDPRLVGPVYIEDCARSKRVHDIHVETCLRQAGQGFGGSEPI